MWHICAIGSCLSIWIDMSAIKYYIYAKFSFIWNDQSYMFFLGPHKNIQLPHQHEFAILLYDLLTEGL